MVGANDWAQIQGFEDSGQSGSGAGVDGTGTGPGPGPGEGTELDRPRGRNRPRPWDGEPPSLLAERVPRCVKGACPDVETREDGAGRLPIESSPAAQRGVLRSISRSCRPAPNALGRPVAWLPGSQGRPPYVVALQLTPPTTSCVSTARPRGGGRIGQPGSGRDPAADGAPAGRGLRGVSWAIS